jgi:hypothetical protein
MTRRLTSLLLLGVALTAGLAGCSSASPAATSAGNNEGAQAPAAPPGAAPLGAAPMDNAKVQDRAGAPAQGGGAPQGGNPAGKPNLPNTTGQRSIVYTGSITVRVDNVNAKASELTTLAIGAGGLVGGDDRQMDAGRSVATLTLRIPADRFTQTLSDIGKLGTEQSRKVSTQDVTATVIDLDARIQTQQASVDRVRALLARAQSIGDITSIESELARREADLESLKAQQRNLADLTALSTIAVTLLGPEAAGLPQPKPAESGFLAGLKAGWRAFTASVKVILTVLGAVLPFAVAIGVPLWLVLLWLRRRGRVPQTGTAAPLSSATTAPKAGSEG